MGWLQRASSDFAICESGYFQLPRSLYVQLISAIDMSQQFAFSAVTQLKRSFLGRARAQTATEGWPSSFQLARCAMQLRRSGRLRRLQRHLFRMLPDAAPHYRCRHIEFARDSICGLLATVRLVALSHHAIIEQSIKACHRSFRQRFGKAARKANNRVHFAIPKQSTFRACNGAGSAMLNCVFI